MGPTALVLTSMDGVAAVRERLLTLSAVTALVGQRVYRAHLPQSPTYPAITVSLVTPIEESHLRGAVALMRTRVQVTSVAQSEALAVAVDNAVQGDRSGSGLTNWSGSVGSPSFEVRWCEPAGAVPFYDPGELRQFRYNRDYWVWHT